MNLFIPRPYQQLIRQHILTTPRCAVWADMGTGKTASTLTAIEELSLVDSGPTLVLAPYRVAATTWPDELKKWSHLQGLKTSSILGTPDQRRASARTPADIYTINYDNLPWLVEFYKGKWPFTKIVADESTRLKSFRLRQGGKRAAALAQVAFKADYFVELTGTPSPNGLIDLWGQFWFLDRGVRLGKSFSAFEDRFFYRPASAANQWAKKLLLPGAEQRINDLVNDLVVRIDAKDWFNLEDPIVTRVDVELPDKAMGLYRQMEKEMFLSLGAADIEAFNAASKTIKCLQLANGAVYDEDGTAHLVHDAKLDALDSIIEEAAGKPVLVAYHFKTDLTRILHRYPQAKVLGKDACTIDEWNAGQIPLLLAHPDSAGHGLNLQYGGNILVFFANWWNLESFQQMVERIGPVRQAQAGLKRPVFIYHIVARGTIDETVLARRESKRDIQDLLLEAAKRKNYLPV